MEREARYRCGIGCRWIRPCFCSKIETIASVIMLFSQKRLVSYQVNITDRIETIECQDGVLTVIECFEGEDTTVEPFDITDPCDKYAFLSKGQVQKDGLHTLNLMFVETHIWIGDGIGLQQLDVHF